MALGHNPKVVTNGLQLYFDMQNTVKSWKGKPTENLVPDPLFTQQNWDTWNGRGADSWSYGVFDGETTAYTDLSINTGERHQLFKDITVSSSLTTFALSIDVYVTPDCDANSIIANQEYPFGNSYGSLGYDFTKKGTWQRLYAIRDNAYTGDTGNIQTRYRFYFGTNNTTGSQGRIYFKNAQLEVGTFATPFVTDSRASTEAIIDLSKNKHIITPSNLTYNSDNTFQFDGTDDYLTIPRNWHHDEFTIEFVAEMFSFSNSSICYNVQGQGLYPRVSCGGNVFTQYRIDGSTVGLNSNSSVSLNTPFHYVFTHDPSVGGKAYLNGNLDASNSVTGNHDGNTGGNMLLGHDTNLSRYGNHKLYQFKLYSRALNANEVANNFNTHRRRYGI